MPRPHRRTPPSINPGALTSYVAIALLLLFQAFTPIRTISPSTQTTATTSQLVENPQLTGPVHISPDLVKAQSTVATLPTRLLIPSVGIDVAVTQSSITNGVWDVSPSSASHGQGSALPGETGNIVIFAHSRVGLFQQLPNTQIGQVVYVLSADSYRAYKVFDRKKVSPQQTEVVKPTATETLTLFTCTGVLDSQRFILRARPL